MTSGPDQAAPDAIAALLRSAGRRREPPPETADAVYVATLLAWQHKVRQRRRLRVALALAAGVVALAAGLAWWPALRTLVQPPMAAVVIATSGASAPLAAGARVEVGRELTVPADTGLVLRTAAGHELRVAGSARLRFAARDDVQLEHGRVYLDSGAAPPGAVLRMAAGLLEITHLGTQYAVASRPEALTVLVRSGRVRVAAGAAATIVERGIALDLTPDGRELARRPIEAHGEHWAWADALAPALVVEGRTLADVLAEIARQSGRELLYQSDSVRLACRATRMHGPRIDLPPAERLAAVLATTEMEAIESGGRILIRFHAPGIADGS